LPRDALKRGVCLKESVFIVLFGIFIYLGVATILADDGLIGSFGSIFASYNHIYFGYISYVYLFIFIVPLYFFYKKTTIDFRRVEIGIASFLLFFSVLLFQALVIENDFRGKLGADFADFLNPYIGVFGLYLDIFFTDCPEKVNAKIALIFSSFTIVEVDANIISDLSK
jgi:S-DNA-T family DNA segregation ATPase FtsK/SpoIIIE